MVTEKENNRGIVLKAYCLIEKNNLLYTCYMTDG